MSGTLSLADLTGAVLEAVQDNLPAEARRIEAARLALPDMAGSQGAWLTVRCPHCGHWIWGSQLRVRHVGCPKGYDYAVGRRVSTTVWRVADAKVPATLKAPADLPALPVTAAEAERLIRSALSIYPDAAARARTYTERDRARVVKEALKRTQLWARADGEAAARLVLRHYAAAQVVARGLRCHACGSYGWQGRQATCPRCGQVIGYDPEALTQSNWPLPLLEDGALRRLALQVLPVAALTGAPLPGLLPDAAYPPALPAPKAAAKRSGRRTG